MSSNLTAYTIENIKEWQAELALSQSNHQQKIVLPSLQRGFVWKPHQIEALWDSILRGYPVGSVLMAVDEETQTKELLDGQQRCTSIALGFYNPFEQREFHFFNAGKKNIVPSLWIDLKPLAPNPNGIKYGVRVLTKSHPWGYQLKDHNAPLTMTDRNKALSHFKNLQGESEDFSYTQLASENIYPYDSYCPVPLALVLKSYLNDPTNWKSIIESWYLERKETLHTKYSHLNEEHDLKKYLEALEPGLKNAFQLILPEISIQKKLLNETENLDNEENSDATLFVRLNSEGTRISGEELIYSLFKSAFPESQTLVEQISSNMFSPSRTINLFIRLALHELNEYTQYRAELSIKNFRQELNKIEFKNKLKEYLDATNKIAYDLFRKLEALFEVKNEHFELPRIYVKELLRRNPDLVVVLLTYLKKNDTNTPQFKSHLHHLFLLNHDGKKTARKLFALLIEHQWDFDKAYAALCRNSELMIQLVTPDVFNEMIVSVILPEYQVENNQHFAWIEFLLPQFEKNGMNLHQLADAFERDAVHGETEINQRNAFVTNFKYLADNFYWNKMHLMVAQAAYFKVQFKDFLEFEGIEDTNRPWDWDHIYPHSWVYNRKNISQKIRWIVNLNGNFRALSYDENRSENNALSPFERLTDLVKRENAFVHDRDEKSYLNDWQYWGKINGQFHHNQQDVVLLTNAMFTRVANIYRKWYNSVYLQESNN